MVVMMWILLAITWIIFLWDLYLCYRQYRVHRDTEKRPDYVKDIISEEDYDKARSYRLDKQRYTIAHQIYAHLQLTILVIFQLFFFLWTLCGTINEKLGFSHHIIQSMIFVTITTLIENIVALPWEIYDTFIIEQKHGFNKQTFGFFLKDRLKRFVISLIIALPVMLIIIYIVENGGEYFFVYVWLFISVVLFVIMAIYPEFIAPLFDVYTPLPHSELRDKIEKLAHDCHFPLKKLYVVHGSKRSAHSNAYMYGIWNNKRIVLYDTLLSDEMNIKLKALVEKTTKNEKKKKEDVNEEEEEEGEGEGEEGKDEEKKQKNLGLRDDEVVAVLGHELGHWQYLHNAFNILFTEVNIFGMLYMFNYFYQNPILYEAFGFRNSKPIIIGFIIIFQYVLAPYDELVSFIMTIMARKMEFSADRYSVRLGHGSELCKALIKLGTSNLSLPIDDWLYSTFNHSHPSIPERISAITQAIDLHLDHLDQHKKADCDRDKKID